MARRSDRPPAKTSSLLDANCMVALVTPWHSHHAAVASVLGARLDAGGALVVAAHALAEAYAVLTRLPAPYRLTASSALELLEANFGKVRTVALAPGDYWIVLRSAPGQTVSGGRTYDALIAACARKAEATELLTLNLGHFEQFAGAELQIRSPLNEAGWTLL